MSTVTLIGVDLGKHSFHHERSQRLLEIPGIGPITASVLMTELGDARQFGSARQFAASVGLVPRQ